MFLAVALSACGDGPTDPPENRPPTLTAISVDVNEDESTSIDILSSATDPDGGTLTLSSFGSPAHGTATSSGSTLTYAPDTDYNGPDQFDVTVADDRNGTVTGTIHVTVTPVNDAPVATADSVTVNEDETAILDVLANDTDVDGDALVLVEASAGHGTAAITDGKVSYTPSPDYSGADTVLYGVSDGAGGTALGTAAITVLGVNDAPSAANDTVSATEDLPLTIDVLANDADPDGDSLTVASFSDPSHGAVTLEGSGLRYEPVADFNGSDSFVYSVTDGLGVDTAIVVLSVAPVPDAPVAAADSATVPGDVGGLIDVLANDTDADGDELHVSSVGSGAHGTTAIEGGQLRYTPEIGFTGADVFDYVVSDATGRLDTASVHVVVAEVNHRPVAADDHATVEEDGSVTIPVLANDTDADGDSLSVKSIFIPGDMHGDATPDGDSVMVHYSAIEHDYNGPDSFWYVVEDSKGAVDTALVSITVTPVNDPPVPVADEAMVVQDSSVLIDVLANDIDPDGDTLLPGSTTYFPDGIVSPSHGTAAWENGKVRYTPDPGYTGSDSFIYWVTDGQASPLGGDVTITVAAAATGE